MKQEKNHQGILTGIEGFTSNSLKPTETMEKVVLPGKDEIKQEKNHQGMLQVCSHSFQNQPFSSSCSFSQGVEGFAKDSLKDVRTREPASPAAILQTEIARDSSLKTVSEFDKSNLKKAETLEKNPLPSSEAIAQELEHIKFKAGIEGYDQSSLSHTTTVEKNTLPTQVSFIQIKTFIFEAFFDMFPCSLNYSCTSSFDAPTQSDACIESSYN